MKQKYTGEWYKWYFDKMSWPHHDMTLKVDYGKIDTKIRTVSFVLEEIR